MTLIRRGGLPLALELGDRLVNFCGEDVGLVGPRSFLTLVFLPSDAKNPPPDFAPDGSAICRVGGDSDVDGISKVDARFCGRLGGTTPARDGYGSGGGDLGDGISSPARVERSCAIYASGLTGNVASETIEPCDVCRG